MSTAKSAAAERAKLKAEQDAIVNRANIQLARSLRVIDSWLPPSTAEQAEDEETKLQPRDVSDTAGLGATTSQAARDAGGPMENLKKQLMGKRAAESARARTKTPIQISGAASGSQLLLSDSTKRKEEVGSRPRAEEAGAEEEEEEEEEEEGRSSMIKSKRQKKSHATTDSTRNSRPSESDGEEETEAPTRSRPAKKSNSFLDELLAERAVKKNKKKKKNQSANSQKTES